MKNKTNTIEDPLLTKDFSTIQIDQRTSSNASNFSLKSASFRTIAEVEEKDSSDQKKKKKKLNFSVMKRMMRYSAQERFLIVLSITMTIISTIFQTLVPMIAGIMLDTVIKEEDQSKINAVAFEYLGVFLLLSLSVFLRTFANGLIGERIIVRMKKDIFEAFINFDIQFFDNKKTGDLLSRLNSDTATIKWASSGSVSILSRNILMCLGSFILLFKISYKLTLVLFAIIPAYIVITMIFSHFLKIYAKLYQDILADASIISEEGFSNIRTVKSFSAEKKEMFYFDTKTDEAYQVGKKRSFVSAMYFSLTSVITFGAVLVVLWYGGHLVWRKEMTPGELTSFMLYTIYLAGSSSSISFALNSIITAIGVAEKLYSYLDYMPQIKNGEGEINGEIEGEIVFENVTFRYPSKKDIEVLKNMSLKIEKGEVIAIVGTSGGGKSTIINLIERFYDIDEGQILIDGKCLKNYELRSLHKNIGYVAQEPVLFSGTIEENIVYGIEHYSEEDLEEACKLANSFDFIMNNNQFPLGFETLVGERGIKLSAGQKQRISIARALIKKPKILIFDEATSALDAESEYQVQLSMENLIKKGDMTIIVIAHRLSTVINCQRILVIKDGVIAEEGTHLELLEKDGVYKNLVQKQMKGQNEN